MKDEVRQRVVWQDNAPTRTQSEEHIDDPKSSDFSDNI
jgi:hypothetical protein